jgi:hypothetical protein
VNEQLMAIVWADEEVRTALLEDTFGSLAALVNRHEGASPLALLDLVTAMSLEHEFRTGAPQVLKKYPGRDPGIPSFKHTTEGPCL